MTTYVFEGGWRDGAVEDRDELRPGRWHSTQPWANELIPVGRYIVTHETRDTKRGEAVIVGSNPTQLRELCGSIAPPGESCTARTPD